MSSSTLIRLCGTAAILAGVLLVAADLLSPTRLFLPLSFQSFSEPTITTSASSFYSALQSKANLLAAVLLLGGLVGLYARQAQSAGLLGLVGFLVAFLGTALLIGFLWTSAFIIPSLVAEMTTEMPELVTGVNPPGFFLSLAAFALGWGMFGVATLRARIYPRKAAVLLVIGALINLLPVPFVGFVFVVAVMWMGFNLLTYEPPLPDAPRFPCKSGDF